MKMSMRFVIAAVVILATVMSASAQPVTGNTIQSNGTITSGGTFQTVLAANSYRRGCTLQNQGTHIMYVFFGAIASATDAKALQLQPGQSVNCTIGGIVLGDAVNLDGTTGDTFVVNAQ